MSSVPLTSGEGGGVGVPFNSNNKKQRRVFQGWKRLGIKASNKRSGLRASSSALQSDEIVRYEKNRRGDSSSLSPSGRENDMDRGTLLQQHPRRRHEQGGHSMLMMDDDTDSAVSTMEFILRCSVALSLAYCCGVWFPGAYPIVKKAADCLASAWLTCGGILLLSYHNRRTKQFQAPPAPSNNALIPVSSQPSREQVRSMVAPSPDMTDEEWDEDELLEEITPVAQNADGPQFELPHPSLDPFYVINTQSGQRCIPNSAEHVLILDNELFTGKMMILIRTPNVDNASLPPGSAENVAVSDYIRSKQRRWEFQWQIKLKRKPTGKVFFACELTDGVKMGVLQRAFVGASMAFVKKMSKSFHYSITGSEEEQPHMAFGVEEGMTRIIVTPPTEAPPTLGGALEEDPDHLKKRLKTGMVDWNTRDTYTMAVWSAYFDFLQWKSLNFPGIRPFTLTSVVGPQHITLSMYEILPGSEEKHTRHNMKRCADLEISNSREIPLGPAAQRWKTEHASSSSAGGINKNSSSSIFRDLNEEDGDGRELIVRRRSSLSFDSDDMEEQTIAELGDGLYLRSGDSVTLNAFSDDFSGCVANGGGFAVLQQNASSMIKIEKKTNRRLHRGLNEVGLIRSGDVVTIKLLINKDEVKYLSIHRGWWLKWVNHQPKINGNFTIHTNESDVDNCVDDSLTETQTSFVTLGGSFWLRHKKWKGYHVGVRNQESATYGGHMLGLYQRDGNVNPDAMSDEEQGDSGSEDELLESGQWMKQVFFRAQEAASSATVTSPSRNNDSFTFDEAELTVSNMSLDVPIWIELMDRTTRRRQLAYVVRVVIMDGDEETKAYCRLKSGRVLAQIIQVGLGRNRSLMTIDTNPALMEPNEIMSTPVKAIKQRSNSIDMPTSPYASDAEEGYQSGDVFEVDVGDDLSDDGLLEYVEGDVDGANKKQARKSRKLMDKIAESVKSSTAKTGKQVVRQSVKVKKGTVSAGKAIIAPMRHSAVRTKKKPPNKEPKAIKPTARSNRKTKRELLAVNKTMRRIGRRSKSKNWLAEPYVLAGQLSPPEQSLRTTSNALSRMSSSAMRTKEFQAITKEEFVDPSELDTWFLQSGASQLGVVPPEDVIHGLLVARCLWESHWREEWCGIYENNLVWFAPLTSTPSLQLSYSDIIRVRDLDFSPLPGYPVLAVETGWQCYYLAFPNEEARGEFSTCLEEQRLRHNEQKENDGGILRKVRFWQGFRDSVAATHHDNHKWAKVPSSVHFHHRTILNARRMVFDVTAPENYEDEVDVEYFVSKLLDLALSTTFDSLETNPAQVVELLNMTSQLRSIPLDRMDLSEPASFCVFVNLYHALLQLALLVTVNGPLHKKSNVVFMRSNCFEIGGDVFSLAELYHCVIRGNTSKPVSPKPPYTDVPKKSMSYNFYALVYTDPRINFVVHTGDTSCPPLVPILRPDTLDQQLQAAAAAFLQKNIRVDNNGGVLWLPKICDVYRNDFGPSQEAVVAYCSTIVDIERSAAVKFSAASEAYHQLLGKLPVEDEHQPGQIEI